MKYSKEDIWQETKDYISLFIGLTIYALGFTAFILPYQITTGGLSGVSAIIYYATGFPVQYTYFLVNAALLIAAIKILGFRFCLKTIVGTLALTFEFDLFQKLLSDESGQLPMILGDQTFMACVLGACCEGVGLAIVFLSNGSTGGTDIIAAIVNKYRDISLGRALMVLRYCHRIFQLFCISRIAKSSIRILRTHHFHDYVGLLYEQCTPIRTVSYFFQQI